MKNLEIYEKVRKVPDAAKKTIDAGRLKGMTDINPMWRIKTLTELFGACGIGWYYKILNRWTQEGSDGTQAAFIEIELYIKVDGEWSMPIIGTGGATFIAKEKNGLHTNDECFKMALTDAISVACKSLGVGADVYWDKDNTKYTSWDGLHEYAKENAKKQDDVFADDFQQAMHRVPMATDEQIESIKNLLFALQQPESAVLEKNNAKSFKEFTEKAAETLINKLKEKVG